MALLLATVLGGWGVYERFADMRRRALAMTSSGSDSDFDSGSDFDSQFVLSLATRVQRQALPVCAAHCLPT